MEQPNNGGAEFHMDGMSLRDYLAAQVLLGFIAYGHDISTAGSITTQAYQFADLMLKARHLPSAAL